MFNGIYLHTYISLYTYICKAATYEYSLNWKAFVQWTLLCCSGKFDIFVQLNDLLNRFEEVWDFWIWGNFSWFNSAGDPCLWYDKSPHVCIWVKPS